MSAKKQLPSLLDCLLIIPALSLLFCIPITLCGMYFANYETEGIIRIICACIGIIMAFCFMIYKYIKHDLNRYFTCPSYTDYYVRLICIVLVYTPIFLCLFQTYFVESYGFYFFFGGFIPYLWDIKYTIEKYKQLFTNLKYKTNPVSLGKILAIYLVYLLFGIFLSELFFYMSFAVLVVLIPMMVKYLGYSLKTFFFGKTHPSK